MGESLTFRFVTSLFLFRSSSSSSSSSLFRNPRNLSATPLPKLMAWACSKCTFLNPPSQKSSCLICFSSTPLSPSSSPSKPTWSCKACTFSNTLGLSSCEICGTRASASLVSSFEELDSIGPNEDSDSSGVGSVFLPLRSCEMKVPEGSAVEMVEDDDDDDDDTFRGVGKSGFLPLRPCKRKAPEGTAVEVVEDDVDDDTFRGVGKSGFLPLRPCKRKVPEASVVEVVEDDDDDTFRGVGKSRALKLGRKEEAFLGTTGDMTSGADFSKLKVLSYNVWFRDDLEMYERMKALGDLIEQHSPDFICFQEVTPAIYNIFQQSKWWKVYCCSVSNKVANQRGYFCMQLSKLPVKCFSCKPFSNSVMGRELCMTEIELGGSKKLVVATSHLESPSPSPPKWNQMYSKERVAQANEAITLLKAAPNVIFAGDMNWDDKLDGQFPLPDGWVDAWSELRPGETGYTYDTKSNKMLSGNRALQKRLDRFLCSLQDFRISEIQMIGLEAIPGLSYCKEQKVKNETRKLKLPVLPSDHYGLLLTICSKEQITNSK